MMDMYKRIDILLSERGISGAKMSTDLGMSRSFMTELRKGRAKSVKLETAQKIADYFGVPVSYLMGEENQKEKPLVNDDQELTDYLEMLKTRPECRMLFQLTKNATKEDVEAAVRIIEALRNK